MNPQDEEKLKEEFHKWGHSICNDWRYQDVDMDELAEWWMKKVRNTYVSAFEIGYRSGARILEESVGKDTY